MFIVVDDLPVTRELGDPNVFFMSGGFGFETVEDNNKYLYMDFLF
jgi:hypothetical protein